jgi:adenylate cyclase
VGKDAGLLFADISGTTRLYRTQASGESQYQLERCLKRMERSIAGNGGRLLTSATDELIATFASADDALLAAIDMQRRIEDLPPVSGVRLSIRIGVNSGRLEDSGEAPSESARRIGRALLSVAGIGQIITCGQTASALSRAQRDSLHSVEGMALPADLGDCPVYQVQWHADGNRPANQGAAAGGVSSPAFKGGALKTSGSGGQPPTLKLPQQLALRWAGKALLVDERSPKISIGRDKACAVTLRGNKASRLHAVIERQTDGSFTLTDDSTNGTYLLTEGIGETRVHGETFVLSGRGKISFGHAVAAANGEIIEFEAV